MTKEKWNQYQNQYRKNHYKQVSAHLDPTLVNALKNKLKHDDISFTDFLKKAITEYLHEELDKK